MPKVNQLTVRCENRPGTLAHIAKVMGDANVNILGFLLTTSGAKGYVKLVVDDVEKAKEALDDEGLSYAEQAVLHAKLPNVPGALGRFAGKLAAKNINITSGYQTIEKDSKKASVVLEVSNVEIAFTRIRTKPKHRSQLYIMAADGTDIRPLGRPPQGANDWDPTWSPDGRELAFVSDRDGNPDVYAMRTDGSGVHRLTESKGPNRWSLNPAWSPTGDEIAFDSNPSGVEEVYVLTIGTGQIRQLTHTVSKGARSYL